MFITHRTPAYTEVDEARMVLEGGCSWIQLRAKGTLDIATAREAVALCRAYNPDTLCCINDDAAMALAAGASGVHLGKNDMPVEKACELASGYGRDNGFIIGATANTFEDIRQAVLKGASYIGLGPYRYTSTKENLSPVLGLEGYTEIIRKCREANIRIPVYAIGGIEPEDVKPLLKAGADGIAVSGSILKAADPVGQTRRFLNEIYS